MTEKAEKALVEMLSILANSIRPDGDFAHLGTRDVMMIHGYAATLRDELKNKPAEASTGQWIVIGEHGVCPFCGNSGVDLTDPAKSSYCSCCGAELIGGTQLWVRKEGLY